MERNRQTRKTNSIKSQRKKNVKKEGKKRDRTKEGKKKERKKNERKASITGSLTQIDSFFVQIFICFPRGEISGITVVNCNGEKMPKSYKEQTDRLRDS